MAKVEIESSLLARMQSLGKMQARYLWFIAVATIFYWQLRSSPSAQLKVPLIDLYLDARAVLEAGPFVLSFLVLVEIGTVTAYTAVLRKHVGHDDARAEEVDGEPNFLEMVFYIPYRLRTSTSSIASVWHWINRNKFVVFLSLALVQPAFLLYDLWPLGTTGRAVFFLLGTATWLLAVGQVVEQWWTKFQNVWFFWRLGRGRRLTKKG